VNILHLRSSEFFGGPERAIVGQCRSSKKFDMMCGSFLRGGKSNRFLEECKRSGIETICIPEGFTGDFRVVGKIREIIKSKRLDLIVTHDYKANFFTYYAVRKSGARQVAHFRGWTAEDFKDKIYNRINWIFLKKIPAVLTVSSTTRQLLINRGIPADRVSVVPNAIDCNDGIQPSRDGQRISGEKIKVVAAGRLSHEKGYDILLDAVSRIIKEAPPFVLSIYGHGPEEESLKEKAVKLGLADCVEFCGFVDDVKPVFRVSDFMVLPSRSEGMPNVILEAWSQKLGVLSTAVGGVPEMIQPGQNGLLVPSEDIPALADKLLFAFANPAEMYLYGEKGHETVREKYSYRKQAELLEKIYTEIAGQ